jgi:hypothetical protein
MLWYIRLSTIRLDLYVDPAMARKAYNVVFTFPLTYLTCSPYLRG